MAFVEDAENDLADIWLRAEDRASITSGAYRIEHELQNGADQVGEDFYGDRIFQFGPLAVVYEMHPMDRLVKVTQVTRLREKR